MIQMFISILIVALSLYATLFVHEWAHYLVAKKLGISSKALNLGLGPILLSHKGKLEINLRLMPIGGYLDIPDMTFFTSTGILVKKRRPPRENVRSGVFSQVSQFGKHPLPARVAGCGARSRQDLDSTAYAARDSFA